MTSERKITSNRKNSQKSTGPKDTSKTRFNAVKHGIFSKQINIALGDNDEPLKEFKEFYRKLKTKEGTSKSVNVGG